ncbi:ABC protein [Lentinula aciculospora]|uniref:ABC protein n=1 Tax=Lentinula aciculospora TaxID=153920 RepID=A0A9W9AC56_9AGAR|nr:ABC protein [Lentinula aciculospora]
MSTEKISPQEVKSSCVESHGHTILENIRLDAGEDILRIRRKWWQLWIPKGLPPPPKQSLADAAVIPIMNASLFSRLTYSWVTPLMVLGYQRILQASDLWKMDETMASAYLSEQLDKAWTRRVQQSNEWNMKLRLGEISPGVLRRMVWFVRALASSDPRSRRRLLERHWRDVGGKREASLAWSLNEVFGHLFWIGGAFKVFGDTCQMMGPLIVKAIINFAKERSSSSETGKELPDVGRGVAMAIGLFLMVICTSICQHQFFWRSMTTGVLARGALTNSVYKRSVVLTGRARIEYTNVKLVNSISTDISRIDAASQWFVRWTAPIQVSVCLIILLVQLGPSALAGFALFLLVAPIQGQVMANRLKIRKTSNVFTDQRAKLLAEVFSTMRIVKYFSYEPPFIQRIAQTRTQEMASIKKMNNIQSANTAFAYSIPVLAATLAFVTYTKLSSEFDIAVVFSSLSLFQLLRQPMMFFPRAMSVTADAQNALARLSKIFHAETLSQTPFIIDPMQSSALQTKGLAFTWELSSPAEVILKGKERLNVHSSDNTQEFEESEPFKVRNINLEVPRHSLTAIVGKCGSGKSSLLQGLIGEMRVVEGTFSFGGKVAYCPQIPWIQNSTVKNNILFGEPFDEERYWRVVEVACLLPDLEIMADGDLTEIGEKGVNLSGGQKQRISIARALYSRAEIFLFDDPLSAVDAHVGRALFHGAIGPLIQEGKTVILVTHTMHILPFCSKVYSMDGGIISTLSTNRPPLPLQVLDKRDKSQIKVDLENNSHVHRTGAGIGKSNGKLIKMEKRSTGSVPWSVYWSYVKAGRGSITIPLIIASIVLMQGSQIVNTYTLVWWQANTFLKPFSFYQILYACLGISQAMFTFFMGLSVDALSKFVSINLHKNVVLNIMYAQMSFFDTTPLGRIQSLLGKDVDSIDNQIPSRIFHYFVILTIANVLGAVIVISILEPYFIIAVFVIAFGYNYFASFYKAGAREIRRLDAMLRSLLYAQVSESLTGLPTIRSYGKIPKFIQDNQYYIDLENRALFITVTTQRWLAIRVDCLGAVLVFFVSLFAVVGVSGVNAAQIGLILTYSTTLTQLCGVVTRQSAEIENYMNAVERAVYYGQAKNIEQEPPHEIKATELSTEWPRDGIICFKDVCMTYRAGLPNVLRNLNIEIRANEKIGIVGRTGAGKSSLILTLLRIVNFEGTITIDGTDISKIGLRNLRTKISMIPQEPTLISGTIRTNLDPFSQYDDAELWDALHRSYLVEDARSESTAVDAILDEKSSSQAITLDTIVEPEGANLSVGQRALLSIARALVKNSKVVILDEATASVDPVTETKIQKSLHSQFKNCTMLCIAHRLQTIISYDRILVMDQGTVAEFDTPLTLFQSRGSIFRSLCEKGGISQEDIVRGNRTK